MKFALIRALSNDERRGGRVCSVIERTGRQPHQVVRGWGRSMAGGFCIDRLRVRPSTPTLRLLARRLRRGDPTGWTRRRREVGEKLARRLAGLERPGALGRDHTHWLFPVMVDDPARRLERLFEGGFQAMPGLSNLTTFEPPADRPELAPREARRILDGVIMLPIHPTLQDSALDRMAGLIAETQEHVRPAGAALG